MKTRSAILFWILVPVLVTSIATAGALVPQTNRDGGVEVKVTPRTLAPGAAAWEFDVVFSTHTVTLTGDPAQFSTLIDTNGRAHAPLAWQGDPPGSHHRKGVLRFKPLADQTQVELRIEGVGAAARSFRWQIQ